jgi:hypothetical protein
VLRFERLQNADVRQSEHAGALKRNADLESRVARNWRTCRLGKSG